MNTVQTHNNNNKQILMCKKFMSHADSVSVLCCVVFWIWHICLWAAVCLSRNDVLLLWIIQITCCEQFLHLFSSSFIHCVLGFIINDMNTVSGKICCYWIVYFNAVSTTNKFHSWPFYWGGGRYLRDWYLTNWLHGDIPAEVSDKMLFL